MLPLLAAVFTASLLGSTHCAGMCGAFLAFAVGAGAPAAQQPPRWALNLAYNLGRLVTYVTLGAIAGLVGAAVDLGGSLVGVQRGAAVGAGAIMVGFGLLAVLRHAGVNIPRTPLPAWLTSLARRAHNRAFDLSPIARAAAVGLLTTLLPCGWLYAFVVTAAGTAHPLHGGLAMAAFWAGTLPVMGALGLGLGALAGPLRRHLPLVTSLALVAVGMWTLLGRVAMPAIALDTRHAPTTLDAALHSVEEADPDEACPLCRAAHEGTKP
jgi:sulfite exporter TauE/SafE